MNAPGVRRCVAVWTVPSAILVAMTWAIQCHYSLAEPEPWLAPEHRAAVLEYLRTVLDGRSAAVPSAGPLREPLPGGGPIVVTVWRQGRPVFRRAVQGKTIETALAELAGDLQPPGVAAAGARLKVDIIRSRGPLLTSRSLISRLVQRVVGVDLLSRFAIRPGYEGILVDSGKAQALLLPDELVRAGLLVASRPIAFIPDFRIGLDFAGADRLLATASGVPAADHEGQERSYVRFRTESFVQAPGDNQAPLPLTRGLPPRPPLSRHGLVAAALAGGRYLVNSLGANGRFVYQLDLSSGQHTDPHQPYPYSLPRHAGTAYFLAELYRLGQRHGQDVAFLRPPLERALDYLARVIDQGGCRGRLPGGDDFACAVEPNPGLEQAILGARAELDAARGETARAAAARKVEQLEAQLVAHLGASALAVVAFAEYRRATGDRRYDRVAAELAAWILAMQRGDGGFAHLYRVVRAERDEAAHLLYYSGEAALALVRMHAVNRGEAPARARRYLAAAQRALDHLVDSYDFFVGGFVYGEEHWTCLAAEAAWPAVKHERYLRFCRGYARFLRAQQRRAKPGEPDCDLAGASAVSPYIMPLNTPTGSQTEAVISSYWLARHHGETGEETRRQALAAAHYLLGQQIRAESEWDVAAAARGAVPASPIERIVRIDFVQHACSAMLRAAELLEDERALGPGRDPASAAR